MFKNKKVIEEKRFCDDPDCTLKCSHVHKEKKK